MFSRFFIARPVFAAVISIVILILGGVAAPSLPIAQYPDVTPPLVQVTAAFPGANGQLVSDTTATPIEQQVNGVDNMLYMESICAADGSMILNVTFDVGTDPNVDQVLTQNRVAMATSQIPTTVQAQGVVTQKSSPSILLAVNLTSTNPIHDRIFLSNYFKLQVYDELLRIPGVAQVKMLGIRDYAIRVWVDPYKLSSYDLAAQDVIAAIESQNVEVAAGVLGQPPVPTGQESVFLINALGRLSSLSEFDDIVVKTGADGELVRVRDIGRVELGAQAYSQNVTYNGQPAILAAIFQLPGSNAITVADEVYAKMDELSKRFPAGMEYGFQYDTTQFVRESMSEVFWTLIDSSIIVSIVIFVFLQSWRTALIPIISLPISLVGSFAIMAMFGFSFNNLSLFGLVLAIGIVVDDAIVVVENVERNMEHGLPPRAASIKAMNEISGAVFAVTLVLSCVFIPAAFITGITGQFYRQFALTIAGSTIISGLNSLTLSPALCAIFLQSKQEHHASKEGALPRFFYVITGALFGMAIALAFYGYEFAPNPLRTIVAAAFTEHPIAGQWVAASIAGLVGAVAGFFLTGPLNVFWIYFFGGFNRLFAWGTDVYTRMVASMVRGFVLVLVVYAVLLGGTVYSLTHVPVGFIPEMDKGYMFVNIKLPDGASLERTDDVVAKVSEACQGIKGVKCALGVAGYSLISSTTSTSMGTVICVLEDFEHRLDITLREDSIRRQLNMKLRPIREAVVIAFGAPPIDGLGASGGFKLQVQDRGDLGPEALAQATRRLLAEIKAQPGILAVNSSYSASLPQLYLDINRSQVSAYNVNLNSIFQTLQTFIGSVYVNQVNLFGRTWQVQVQAEAAYRLKEADLRQLKVRSNTGQMVPLAALVSVRQVTGPERVSRYNMFRAADVMGVPSPLLSSGQAITMVEELSQRSLPSSMTIAWTDLYFQQIRAGNTAIYVFIFAAIMVFLVLSAQYESWSLPLAVVLIVPMCILCAMVGVMSRHMDNNIFTQVGLLVLVGLSSKNAILIVEFAKQLREEGRTLHDSVLEAAKTRLRPILMTSACFAHMIPLYFALGAGSEMRRALGTAVLWGAFGVTLLGIFFTPIFYYAIDRWLIGDKGHRKPEEHPAEPGTQAGPQAEAAK